MPNRYVLRIDEQVLRELSLSAEAGAFATLGGGATLEYGGPLIPAESGAFTTSGASATLDFSGSTILFHSDWSTATGTTDAALRDTDKTLPWDNVKGTTPTNEVVDVTSLTPPDGITRALAIKHEGGTNGASAGVRMGTGTPGQGSLPGWSNGVRRFWRVYLYNSFPDDPVSSGAPENGIGTHPVQDGPSGVNTNWYLNIFTTGTVGTWWPGFNVGSDQWRPEGYTTAAQRGNIVFNKNEWYRMEWGFERVDSTTFFFVGMKVYDDTGTLVFDIPDMEIWAPVGLRGTKPAAETEETMDNPQSVTDQQCGVNGLKQTLNDGPTYTFFRWAAFAVGEGNWIGAYSNGI